MKLRNIEFYPLEQYMRFYTQMLDAVTWYPLQIYPALAQLDREIGFMYNFDSVECIDCSHYLSLFLDNINNPEVTKSLTCLRVEMGVENIPTDTGYGCIITDNSSLDIPCYSKYVFGTRTLYLHDTQKDRFKRYILNTEFTYDNLINMVIMVKNAGDIFRDTLTQNLSYIDRYTILDTGSTDNTLDIARDVLKDIPGDIYTESFINFKDSRNRALELAGHTCTFNIMLDDTYVITDGHLLREFLTTIRGDNIAESFSLYVKSTDVTYSSNRVFKPCKNIKYEYRIHEIPIRNLNVLIDEKHGYITDLTNPYMVTRTKDRKTLDLQLLFEDAKDFPNNPRPLYYIAETFLYMNDYEFAYKYYKIRSEIINGYDEERYDSLYKLGVIGDTYLNKSWDESLRHLLDAHELDPQKIECLYYIGDHYSKINKPETAYMFLKYAHQLGIPKNKNMNNRIEIYNIHLPLLLYPLYLSHKEYKLGYELAQRSLTHYPNHAQTIQWCEIFRLLSHSTEFSYSSETKRHQTRVIYFIDPNGWSNWDGRSLYQTGLGGSETWVIKYAETIARLTGFIVRICCKCDNRIEYNNVTYFPLSELFSSLTFEFVDVCLINRRTELIPAVSQFTQKTFMILHDLIESDTIIPVPPSAIHCISEWHSNNIKNTLPHLKDIIHTISYGIEPSEWNPNPQKEPYSFIYASFPNRGLYWLLKLFPFIVEKFPLARLHIYSDINHWFARKYSNNELIEIEKMIAEQKDTVFLHGWVNLTELKMAWEKSHIWFYPCHFQETCCLTAYHAAISKTLVITNDLAALSESACNGIIIKGSVNTQEWQTEALNKIFYILDANNTEDLIQMNHTWILQKSYENVVSDYIKKYLA